MRSFLVLSIALILLHSAQGSAKIPRTVMECVVDGDGSPEASLRKVDALAFQSVYCKAGCDAVVNMNVKHSYASKLSTLCTVEKIEENVKPVTNASTKKDRNLHARDITAYTVGKATFRLGCFSQSGQDYTKAAADRIELDTSICTMSL